MSNLIHKTGLQVLKSTYQGSTHMVKDHEGKTVFLGSIWKCNRYVLKAEETRLNCL